MSQPKHTPGPWEFRCEVTPLTHKTERIEGYVSGNPKLVPKHERPHGSKNKIVTETTESVAFVHGATIDEMQANAHLIAAAPELLELLKSVAANRRLLNDDHFSGVADKLFAQIDGVLARAEGREP